jgi:Ca-activated chloride channel family protein
MSGLASFSVDFARADAGVDVLTEKNVTQIQALKAVKTSRMDAAMRRNRPAVVALALMLGAASLAAQDGFKFKSGVELVNVTATVTDDGGRFVPSLRKDDFTVYDNGQPQEITQFSSDRVPVSLGILLDSSGSMTADKMASARAAINRLTTDLLGGNDEMFFMDFSQRAHLLQDWTTDRRAITRALDRVDPNGGTAMYDAIATALPVATGGRNQKKAILVISDGNDTNSNISVRELRQAIRESEVLVYALGVDGTSEPPRSPIIRQPSRPPLPIPFPFPGSGRGGRRFPQIIGPGRNWPPAGGERVNADALRQITDDTGGRTEIVHGFGDLDDAVARIADELSKQYYLGYATTAEKDGRWHTIRVDVRDRRLTVRARKGYVAS